MRRQQKDDGKRNGYPVDTPCLDGEQSDTDKIEPAVECGEIEPVNGNAVIIKPSHDAYGHQQQQRQYQYGHPAGNPVVKPFVIFKACGIQTELNGDAHRY